jgi:hypothetical protein
MALPLTVLFKKNQEMGTLPWTQLGRGSMGSNLQESQVAQHVKF